MFCGHFHTAPTQILTGEVRVEIRPSDPTQGFHILGCSCGGQEATVGRLALDGHPSLPGLIKEGRACPELRAQEQCLVVQ